MTLASTVIALASAVGAAIKADRAALAARFGVESITYGTTITPNAANLIRTKTCTLTGNVTVAAPSSPTAGQPMLLELTASGAARTVTLVTTTGGFRFGTNVPSQVFTVPSGGVLRLGFFYRGGLWDVAAADTYAS